MTFPYGPPGEATYAQCDPLIVDLVRRINDDGPGMRLQTVQSCEGHPWPFLELVGPMGSLLSVMESMALALPEKVQLLILPVIREGQGGRWRFTVIPTQSTPERVAEARAVLAAPWLPNVVSGVNVCDEYIAGANPVENREGTVSRFCARCGQPRGYHGT